MITTTTTRGGVGGGTRQNVPPQMGRCRGLLGLLQICHSIIVDDGNDDDAASVKIHKLERDMANMLSR